MRKTWASGFVAAAVLITTLAMAPRAAAQQDEEGPTSLLSFQVLKDDNGKPVRSASVIMHPVGGNGKQGKGGMELKTDAEGKSSFDGIPYGKLRVQVLAPGYQTYGEDFDVNKPKMDFTIKLKRPQSQYSIYGPGKDSSTPPKQDAPPPDKNQKPN
ncbi:MAG: carboxypeptidase-like regulatory domain-containing protein [Candidatus Sulfotelmatobacter sp.]